MMKLKTKKGFTMIELVIVIAVVAVLAAVLIPTFSSMVRKANISSDIVLAKNLNTAVSIYKTENSIQDLTFEDALKAAKERGYVLANLNAKAKDCYFVWENQSDQFLLIEDIEQDPGYNVLFNIADGFYAYDSTKGEENKKWCFAVSDVDIITYLEGSYEDDAAVKVGEFPDATYLAIVTSVSDFTKFIESVDEIGGTKSLYINEDLQLEKKYTISNPSTEITLNLEDYKLSSDTVLFYLEKGQLNIVNGNLNGGGTANKITIDGQNGKVLLKEVTLENNYIGLLCGESVIEDCVFVNNASTGNWNSPIAVQRNVNVTIKNTKLVAGYHGFSLSGGCDVTITGGTYENTSTNSNAVLFYLTNMDGIEEFTTVTINDGAFISKGKLFQMLSSGGVPWKTKININGGTFTSGDKSISYDQMLKELKEVGIENWMSVCGFLFKDVESAGIKCELNGNTITFYRKPI